MLAEGVLGDEVMMRGDRMGNMFTDQPYDLIPGQWGGIVLTSTSYGNHFNYCDIHSGSFGVRCDSSDANREKVRIENSVLHNMQGDVLSATSSSVFVGNSQLTNAGGNCVTLLGGRSRFVHCTIANFYAFAGGRGVALAYSNTAGGTDYPLHQADFINCLITGYSDDEIMGTSKDDSETVAFNYFSAIVCSIHPSLSMSSSWRVFGTTMRQTCAVSRISILLSTSIASVSHLPSTASRRRGDMQTP